VIVLDYSKSMFARDVPPSRILRAKSEVGQLISELPGARFGAVAFAGEPLSFPLTSDGGAIAQFFRQLSPNDMPVGGTAIGRALVAGRELLMRDPLAMKHRRVLLLVTDGEDLEGDPVTVAQAAQRDQITIHVVQIGGRTPEPVPDVDEAGEVKGIRTDEDGKPITTSLSAEGEAQLAKIAEVSGGRVVRSEHGETGIREITTALKRMMSEELSERVETVYADVFAYPLGFAIVLLVAEAFVGETRRRKKPLIVPPPPKQRRIRKKRPGRRAAAAAATAAVALWASSGCQTIDELFTRNAPVVDQAISTLDAGDAGGAVSLLEEYLSTGKCESGNIGTPDSVRNRHNAGFDLGLGLFRIAEQFGRRFGDEKRAGDAGTTPEEEARLAARREEVECALRIVRLIAADTSVPIDLRARADYLAGNLEFLRQEYRSAVSAYDLALRLIPGLPEDAGGDGIGRDAAWNRAIALKRIEDEENRRDASADAPQDSPEDAPKDGRDNADSASRDAGKDGPDKNEHDRDAGKDGADRNQNQKPDAGPQDKGDAAPPEPQPQSQSPSVNQDERILDMLERAPTLQQHDAKNRALQQRVRGMEDK
jgi:Ca-activated chloride channel family protein